MDLYLPFSDPNFLKQGPQNHSSLARNTLKSLKTRERKKLKSEIGHLKHKKWLPYQILGDKTLEDVQIDQQTTEILSTELNVPLSD